MNSNRYLTFDEYVMELRNSYTRNLEWWAREHRIVDILKKHGGPDFRDYENDDLDHSHPGYPKIPDAPNIDVIRPFSRITLASPSGDDMYLFDDSKMLVVSVGTDSFDGFVYDQTRGPIRRETVTKEQVIECTPPLQLGEDELGQFNDDIPF